MSNRLGTHCQAPLRVAAVSRYRSLMVADRTGERGAETHDVPRLIVIPISHYCEKARWALDRARVEYVTEKHMPLWHWTATVSRGGRTVPMLVTEAGTLPDSRGILDYADRRAPAALKIYPDAASEKALVDELTAEYDRKLGPSTRRWVYFHVLADKTATLRMLGAGVPAFQRSVIGATFPVVRAMMRRAMRVDATNTARSLEYVRKVFAETGARLGKRRFLVGDRFSAADLTFAALAAPMIFPPEYGTAVPPREAMPPAMTPVVEELRATAAGAFVLRMFREERHT
jgi:glutathione S-transferase